MVNTFLPLPSISKSWALLDKRRYLKQLVEATQIINALEKLEKNEIVKGFVNHPAVRMWKGYIPGLKYYFNLGRAIWIQKGHTFAHPQYSIVEEIVLPWFIGWKDFHYSHMASLMRKEPNFYYPLFSSLCPILNQERGYIWPVDQSLKELPLLKITEPSYVVRKTDKLYIVEPTEEYKIKKRVKGLVYFKEEEKERK